MHSGLRAGLAERHAFASFRCPHQRSRRGNVRDRRTMSAAAGRGKGFGSRTQEDKESMNGSSKTARQPNGSQNAHTTGPRTEPNELLKKFFESKDKSTIAEQYSDSLSEKFFIVLDSFMSMATKEGNVEVINTLRETLEAAMKVKQKSLRPEIQLLNQLLSDKSFTDRAVRLSSEEALKTLQMNDGYFFELLKMMTMDANRSAKNEFSTSTQQKLIAIQKECTARLQSSVE